MNKCLILIVCMLFSACSTSYLTLNCRALKEETTRQNAIAKECEEHGLVNCSGYYSGRADQLLSLWLGICRFDACIKITGMSVSAVPGK